MSVLSLLSDLPVLFIFIIPFSSFGYILCLLLLNDLSSPVITHIPLQTVITVAACVPNQHDTIALASNSMYFRSLFQGLCFPFIDFIVFLSECCFQYFFSVSLCYLTEHLAHVFFLLSLSFFKYSSLFFSLRRCL